MNSTEKQNHKHGKTKATTAIIALLLFTLVLGPTASALVQEGHINPPAEYPILAWEQNGGSPWLSNYYNASSSSYNPYSPGPNTSHMLWIRQVTFGGVVGGAETRSLTAHEFGRSPIVFGGIVFYGTGQQRASASAIEALPGAGQIVALDLYTGEELYSVLLPGNASDIRGYTAVPDTSPSTYTRRYTVYLGAYGGAYAIDAWTGSTLWHYVWNTSIGTTVSYYNHMLYLGGGHMTNSPTREWTRAYSAGDEARYLSPVSFETPVWETETGIGRFIVDGAGLSSNRAVNATTGEIIWEANADFQGSGWTGAGYGKIFQGGIDGNMYAFDATDGHQVWKSEVNAGIWGYGGTVAYGKVYQGSYAGKFFCWDAETGNVDWEFDLNDYQASLGLSVPEIYQSDFGGWPFHNAPCSADGKVYALTGQHSPESERTGGHKVLAFDGETGDVLWTFPAQSGQQPLAISEGVLFVPDGNANRLLAFSKGPTAIELTVPQGRINLGDYTWINGRLTDQSPAQKDTPVVAKESMDVWMAYLHGGGPEPASDDIKGVPVKLQAVSSDGTVTDIGVTTTNSNGDFSYKWIPTTEDNYKIRASFAGDESYYESNSTTNLAVGQTVASSSMSSPSSGVFEQSSSAFTVPEVAIVIAVAVAVLIGVVNLVVLRKVRQKT